MQDENGECGGMCVYIHLWVFVQSCAYLLAIYQSYATVFTAFTSFADVDGSAGNHTMN